MDLGRKICAFFIFLIFFWMWPYRLFTNKNNCYFWTLEKLITKVVTLNGTRVTYGMAIIVLGLTRKERNGNILYQR